MVTFQNIQTYAVWKPRTKRERLQRWDFISHAKKNSCTTWTLKHCLLLSCPSLTSTKEPHIPSINTSECNNMIWRFYQELLRYTLGTRHPNSQNKTRQHGFLFPVLQLSVSSFWKHFTWAFPQCHFQVIFIHLFGVVKWNFQHMLKQLQHL